MKLEDIVVLNEQPGNKENETFRRAPPVGDISADKGTTAQIAKKLKVTPSRVRQMKQEGKLKKVDGPVEGRRDNYFDSTEADTLKDKKEKGKYGPGRPKKRAKKDE